MNYNKMLILFLGLTSVAKILATDAENSINCEVSILSSIPLYVGSDPHKIGQYYGVALTPIDFLIRVWAKSDNCPDWDRHNTNNLLIDNFSGYFPMSLLVKNGNCFYQENDTITINCKYGKVKFICKQNIGEFENVLVEVKKIGKKNFNYYKKDVDLLRKFGIRIPEKSSKEDSKKQ